MIIVGIWNVLKEEIDLILIIFARYFGLRGLRMLRSIIVILCIICSSIGIVEFFISLIFHWGNFNSRRETIIVGIILIIVAVVMSRFG